MSPPLEAIQQSAFRTKSPIGVRALQRRSTRLELCRASRAMDQLRIQAASCGKVSALRWLRALCLPIRESGLKMMQTAAACGQLGVLRFLRSGQAPAPWDGSVPCCAAAHFDCLKWLLTQEPICPCDDNPALPYLVASLGSLEALAWLRAHAPIPLTSWDEACTAAAVQRDDLPMLIWLRSQDPPCPWDSRCCKKAVKNSSINMLQWLRSQQPPCPWDARCTLRATQLGDLSMLRWLLAQDPPCPHCTAEAARQGHLAVLEWLCSQGVKMDGVEYYHAASEGHHHVLR